MAAFERIKSGIPGLDEALDNIRLGDNVVWNVTNLNEFSYFVNPYVKQAKYIIPQLYRSFLHRGDTGNADDGETI